MLKCNPIQKYNFPQQSINSIIFNAKSAINQRIRYNLGSGGFDPKYKLPTKDGLCDCSGFVCWALEFLERQIFHSMQSLVDG